MRGDGSNPTFRTCRAFTSIPKSAHNHRNDSVAVVRIENTHIVPIGETYGLELEAELALYNAGIVSVLRGDRAENRRIRSIVDQETRVARLRMVENIEHVHPELQALAFRNLE